VSIVQSSSALFDHMTRVKPWKYWVGAAIVYWLFALKLLQHVFRIFADDGGLVASFYWGHRLLVASLVEYSHDMNTRLRFYCPYWIAATMITLVGCGLTFCVSASLQSKPSRRFIASSATTLAALLLVCAISDLGTTVNAWRGPRMYNSLQNLAIFLEVLMPVSLLSGVLALIEARLTSDADGRIHQ
jgi:hypothetical protein